jgi:hypothetical protein
MAGDPEECREHAKRCWALADKTTNPALKESLVELAQRWASLASDLEFSVEVQDTSIIVTMPGTDFSVTYQKRFGNPHLVLTRSRFVESVTSPVVSEFRARAFQAAVDKARELGWIA